MAAFSRSATVHICTRTVYTSMPCTNHFELASLAQSDARPTDDQEVADSISVLSGNIFSWRFIMKCFLREVLPFR